MAEPRASLFGPRPKLPRPVWLVSWTSFFTDTASEAVYPLLPLFLTRVLGGGAFALGIVEGAAEGLNALLRIVSGRLSDRWQRRKPLVLAGYGLSSVVRPLIGFATAWPHVLLVRLADRVGKGIRGAPRDALLASWADPSSRGYVFGLHRAMDHAGAVVGPLLASLFLWTYPGEYRTLFLLTVIPGAIAVGMLLPVPDRPGTGDRGPGTSSDSRPSSSLSPAFRRYLVVLTVFALGNSTDAFLLLRLSDLGVGAAWIPVLWAALHVVKAGISPIGGLLSDRFDCRRIIMMGWLIYAAVYVGFAFSSSLVSLVPIFLAYGLYYGLTEGVEKAVVADLAPAAIRGLAFGWYHAVVGIGALLASLAFGMIWKWVSASAAFLTGSALALAASALLSRLDLRGLR
jgi:MFS family permease